MTERRLSVAVFDGTDPRVRRCFEIRRVVFIIEQQVPEEEELDGRDAGATHFLAQRGGEDVGCARMRVVDKEGARWAKAERVAVHARARGEGVGRVVMQALEGEAQRQGCVGVVLGAQLTAVPFYLRLAYEAYGPQFDDAGIPHRMMRRVF